MSFCRPSLLNCLSILFLGVMMSIGPEAEAQLAKYKKQNFTQNSEVVPDKRIVEEQFSLSNQARIRITYQKNLTKFARLFHEHLERDLVKYQKQFGAVPEFKLKIKLMDPDSFFRLTKAPYWTNALYYKNQILLPAREDLGERALLRTLSHEFAHALTSSLSNDNCPGWLDEGIAQWAEEKDHTVLKTVLTDWVTRNSLISFEDLQSGFTKLEPKLIPVAYAQSLVTLEVLIRDGHREQIIALLKDKKKISNRDFWKKIGLEENILGASLSDYLLEENLADLMKDLPSDLNLTSDS